MTFAFTTNTTPATGSLAMYSLFALMLGNGFTCPADSDGTTYSSSGGQVTGGASGAHGIGNTSAWKRFKTLGSKEYVVQRGTTDLLWRAKMSISAGFSGGSPGATQVPSATDEVVLWGGGTDSSPTFTALFAANGGYRFNAMVDTATTGGFYSFGFPTGGGTLTHSWVDDPLTNCASTDGFKFALHMSQVGMAQGQVQTETFAASTAFLASTTPKTSPVGTDFLGYPALALVSSSNSAVIPKASAVNPISGADPAVPMILWRRSALANPAYKGLTTYLRWLGIARTIGDAFTVSTTRDRICVGDVSLPWDGSVPTV